MNKTGFIILALAIFGASAGVSLAEPLQIIPGIQKNKWEVLKKVKMETAEERCARITKNIEKRTENFEENKNKHYSAYKNLKDRIEKFVAKLSAKGYSIDDLAADLSVLDTKIQKFNTSYAAYQAKLGETKEYACGHSDEDFKVKLAEARTLLKTVREDSKDIKNYYLNTIRPDLKEIRKQKLETKEGE